MSFATPAKPVAERDEGNMDRVSPHEEQNTNTEQPKHSDEILSQLTDESPSWFCKLIVSKPLSVFGMFLRRAVFICRNYYHNKIIYKLSNTSSSLKHLPFLVIFDGKNK